jgi:hypothetical protein
VIDCRFCFAVSLMRFLLIQANTNIPATVAAPPTAEPVAMPMVLGLSDGELSLSKSDT